MFAGVTPAGAELPSLDLLRVKNLQRVESRSCPGPAASSAQTSCFQKGSGSQALLHQLHTNCHAHECQSVFRRTAVGGRL